MNSSVCFYCDKTFSTKFNLQRHINSTHLKMKTVQCPVCFKWFVSKQNVRHHMYIHSQEKPFMCTVDGCQKRFRQVSQMREHRKIHQRHENRLRIELEPLYLSRLPWPTSRKEEISAPSASIWLPPIAEDRVFSSIRLPLAPGLGELI